MLVWVTRAAPGAEATAERLRALGHEPIVAPVLTVRPSPDTPLDLTDVGALAFTSATAVRIFGGRAPAGDLGLADLQVFAVGGATAAAARAAGFRRVASADGDVVALARLILERRNEIDGVLLHPGAAEPAGDLAGELNARGVAARAVAIYQTTAIDRLPDPLAKAFDSGDIDALLLHSPKAGRTVARLLAPHAEAPAVARLSAFGLSAACIAPLEALRLGRLDVAARQTEAALLALLDG